MGGARPTVSVVIPTRKRPDRVIPLIERILAEDGLLDLLVVTSPGDPSQTAIEAIEAIDPRLTLVLLDVPQSAQIARLAGARRAQGDLVLLIDDDVLPEPGIVEGHRAYHAEHDGVVVVGSMPVRLTERRQPGQASNRIYADEWLNWTVEYRDNPLDALWGGHMSLPRDVYVKVEEGHDGWDDAYHEDTDLGFRLAKAGLRGVAAYDLKAEHLQQRNLTDVIYDAERQVYGLLRLAERHPELHGGLPSHMREPKWLFNASRPLDHPRVMKAFVWVGLRGENLAGRLHLWKAETTIVRLLRRVVAMSTVRRMDRRSNGSAPKTA